MSVVVALMLAFVILLNATIRPSAGLSDRIGRYLRPEPRDDGSDVQPLEEQPVADAGLGWSRGELFLRRSAAAAASGRAR